MKSLQPFITLWLILIQVPAMAQTQSAPPEIDLTHATVVSLAEPKGVQAKAIQMLVEEVERRTRVRWTVTRSLSGDTRPRILIGMAAALQNTIDVNADSRWNAPEGYRVQADARVSRVVVAGVDSRG